MIPDGAYFFVCHCPCRLTMCKIKACCFCWELFQFVPSCYSGENGSCRFYPMAKVLWICWLLSFILMFTFRFSESTSARNFLFISNSEADVPELFLVARSANMTKYGSLLSSLYFRSILLTVWIALSKKPLLFGNSRLKVLCMKSHNLKYFLKSCELDWGPLSLNTTLGMAYRANILLIWVMTASDEAFGSWARSDTCWCNL